MEIIKEIENEIELIELAQKLQITFFNKQNLITSHEEIRNINKINQTINQVTKKLQKLFTISPYTTLPKTKKSFLSNYSNNRHNATRPKPYSAITPNVDEIKSNYANFLSIHINYEIFQFFFLTLLATLNEKKTYIT